MQAMSDMMERFTNALSMENGFPAGHYIVLWSKTFFQLFLR